MTQAYNLSQLANNLNSAGQVDATDGLVNAVPVANGGTGASTQSAARTNLGLGTIATQNSNSVSITGGSVSGITDLAVADGGTGASTAADARTNLGVPSTTGSGASGTWGISITGNAATSTAAANSLGVGQTWQNLTGSRALGSSNVYTNNTGKPIQVSVVTVISGVAGDRGVRLFVGGVLTAYNGQYSSANAGTTYQFVTATVPDQTSYYADVTGIGGSLSNWAELR